jgi:Mlc titration factor MtfA (ptsG expression regulator)
MDWPWVSARRRRQRSERLSAEAAAEIARLVPAVADLDDTERAVHEGLMAVFLHEKAFEGCGGLVLTDEIRHTIAASACLLLVGLDVTEPFPGLDVIRVYPSTVRVPRSQRDGHIVTESAAALHGVSSRGGYIVLSWEAAREGAGDPHDGHNVVLHEFAHQLDTEDGAANGAPILPAGLYGPWARILGAAFAQLVADVEAARPTALDAYGATNPAEFFAVATEMFFERPRDLLVAEPALYAVLERYYRPKKAHDVR